MAITTVFSELKQMNGTLQFLSQKSVRIPKDLVKKTRTIVEDWSRLGKRCDKLMTVLEAKEILNGEDSNE
jgi:hypothetical protein